MTELIREKEIVLYETNDGKVSFDVNVMGETVWLTQMQIADLFEKERSVITKHINNIFKEGELIKNSVRANFAHTASDGKTYQTEHYNLDVIISVGYRVKSYRGTQFRQWATQILKQYMLNGIVINNRRIELIEEQVKLLGQKISDIQSNSNLKQENRLLEQQMDNRIQNQKITQLSKRVGELTQIMNEFQDNNLIIKRPEEGGGIG